MPTIYLVLVGPQGCGKTKLADYLYRAFDVYPDMVFETNDLDEAKGAGLKHDCPVVLVDRVVWPSHGLK